MEKPSHAAAPEAQKPEEGRDSLPELRLTQLARSEKPIDQLGNKKSAIESFNSWNNFTIITLDGSDEITLYDEGLKKVEDFKPPLSDKDIIIDWTLDRVKKKVGKQYIADTKESEIFRNIDNLPLEFKALAKLALDQQGTVAWDMEYKYLNLQNAKPTKTKSNKLIVSDKYILLLSDQFAYSALVTQNDQGILLSPRNWKRLNLSDDMPEDLSRLTKKAISEKEGYKTINDKYSATITDAGLYICAEDTQQTTPVFSDRLVPSIENNLTKDPVNPNLVYYCQSSNPDEIARLDISAEPSTWNSVKAKFPKKYGEIRNLQLDPTGNFFLFYSGNDCVMITKEGLDEVKRIPGLTHVNFDGQGKIRAVDQEGHLVIYEPEFSDLIKEIDKRRITKLAQGINITDIFEQQTAAQTTGVGEATFENLKPLRERNEEAFREILAKAQAPDDITKLRDGMSRLRSTLQTSGLKPDEIKYMMEGIEQSVLIKEKDFAGKRADEALKRVRSRLDTGISIATISEARSALKQIKAVEGLLDSSVRQEIEKTAQELEEKAGEMFRTRGGEIIKDVRGLVERVKTDLGVFTNKSRMDDWLEFDYPQLKERLAMLANDCPAEADEAYKAIIAAREDLAKTAATFENKFKHEYAAVREIAAGRQTAIYETLRSDISGYLDRLRSKGFSDRRTAEDYLRSSEAAKALEREIDTLATLDPDAAKELKKLLKANLSVALSEIERGAQSQVTETGQQMIMFGDTAFPKWEAKVKEKETKSITVTFDEDPKTHGPGIKPADIYGDVALSIKNPDGTHTKIRLYEVTEDENEWRLGLLSYRGSEIPPSYLSAAEFKKFRSHYTDWSLGEKSLLKKAYHDKRNKLHEIYAERNKISSRDDKDDSWKESYKKSLEEFAQFASENHITLLQRIDRLKSQPEIETANGKGFVPEWQSHWVTDRYTDTNLEKMAELFKMQMELQEGILNLKGHAGSGKDVLIKMFAAQTHRPYFATDCTKWTTEFELSEDVVLEAKDGASYTVKVPSTVLSGISTPGAIVYFNEFTAMPEQAQIFLHALMDEKRSLTLKTSSGKTIKAHPSVLLASSENPLYPGTFTPQFATKSRQVSMIVDYPPLTKQPEQGDTNPNPLYDPSEALRIARGVDSLADMTYEVNLERNDFVNVWNKYVNGLDNGAQAPAGTQKFDIDTLLALVQFSAILREDFFKIFEKTKESRNALPVTQPITGRELRRCAYALSKISPEEKATANPEAVARNLLEKFYLTHYEKQEDKDKIKTAMQAWTSKKRIT